MIIMQGRGSQFDPEVVDAFFARERDIYDTRTNFRDTQLFSRLQQLEAKLDQLVAEEEAQSQAENK
jgi:HD-GYP domain-containing protein (c-di-GMP phosphodiesterase class II)